MKELDDLFSDIKVQLNIEKSKYKKLELCKYSFEISKVAILSLATGLSFLNIFAILSIILIPVIDTTKHTANVDQRLTMCKLKKNLLKELYNYKATTYKILTEEKINHLYTKLTNKLSVINTFLKWYKYIYMTIINFDNIIGKKFNTITNNFFCLSHPKNA